MSKAIKIGDKVRFVDRKAHEQTPEYYPSVGTIGTVVMDECNPKDWKIQWPKGTTSGNDRWYCGEESIELFDGKIEKDEMTSEEIWEMLESKMEKNGVVGFNLWDGDTVYYEFDVINAVVIAYRSGYERCMKGRPFKFGENRAKKKKKSGHWEPVDSKNLPRNGTKVRYTRHNVYWEEKTNWKIGDCGHVLIFKGEKYSFGVCPDKIDSRHAWDWCNCPECLDMWVEDDE